MFLKINQKGFKCGTRVAIIGAGAVGASCAYALALNGSCRWDNIYMDIGFPDIGNRVRADWPLAQVEPIIHRRGYGGIKGQVLPKGP